MPPTRRQFLEEAEEKIADAAPKAERGHAALDLLNNRIFQEAVERTRARIIKGFEQLARQPDVPPDGGAAGIKLTMELQLLAQLVGEIKRIAGDGAVAKAAIAEAEEQADKLRRMNAGIGEPAQGSA